MLFHIVILLALVVLTAYTFLRTHDAHHFRRESEQEQNGRKVGVYVCRRHNPPHFERRTEG